MTAHHIVFLALFFINAINCAEIRRARGLREPYTTTVEESTIVSTILIPSSCVLVEPTLPPCRKVRFLSFPSIFGAKSETIAPIEIQPEEKTTVNETPLGWGEYLGIYRPTVTLTTIVRQTEVIIDRDVVVTYSVLGCKPLSLPPNIDRCPNPTTVDLVVPTKVYANPPEINENDQVMENQPFVQPSSVASLPLVIPTIHPDQTSNEDTYLGSNYLDIITPSYNEPEESNFAKSTESLP